MTNATSSQSQTIDSNPESPTYGMVLTAKEVRTANAPAKLAVQTTWAIGWFTQGRVEILETGMDHNDLESKTAALNKAAKGRVAFIINADMAGIGENRTFKAVKAVPTSQK